MFGLLDREAGLGEFELFWTGFYIVYAMLIAVAMAMTMERRGSVLRTIAGWTVLIGAPLALIASLPFTIGMTEYHTGIPGVDRGPLIGPLILCAPVTAIAGALLYRGGRVNRIAAALLDYVIITVASCMLPLGIVKCLDRALGIDVPEFTLCCEIAFGAAAVLLMRRRMAETIRSFSSDDGGFAERYATVLAPMSACIAGSLILWLYDPREDSIYTIGICLLTAVAFIIVIRAVFLGIDEMAESARRDAELEAARELQLSAVPDGSAVDWMLGAEIASHMEPAKEVAGDFLDFFPIGDRRIGMVVADVSGKGIPAALFMMRCRSVIRDRMTSGADLGSAAESANASLCDDNPSCMFVTAFMGVLDLDTGRLEYVCAGHPAPFVRSAGGIARLNGGRGPMMGLMDVAYRSDETALADGDMLLAFTDGVSEAECRGSMFGEEGIGTVLSSSDSPQDALSSLLSRVRRFADGTPQNDDVTVLAMRFHRTASRVFCAVPGGCGEAVAWTAGQVQNELSLRAELVAEEVFLNIASYAYADGGDARITVLKKDGSARISFVDSGAPFDPTAPRDRDDAPIDERDPGGEGIGIVMSVCRSAAYCRIHGRNALTLDIGGGP